MQQRRLGDGDSGARGDLAPVRREVLQAADEIGQTAFGVADLRTQRQDVPVGAGVRPVRRMQPPAIGVEIPRLRQAVTVFEEAGASPFQPLRPFGVTLVSEVDIPPEGQGAAERVPDKGETEPAPRLGKPLAEFGGAHVEDLAVWVGAQHRRPDALGRHLGSHAPHASILPRHERAVAIRRARYGADDAPGAGEPAAPRRAGYVAAHAVAVERQDQGGHPRQPPRPVESREFSPRLADGALQHPAHVRRDRVFRRRRHRFGDAGAAAPARDGRGRTASSAVGE